jgi:hypothetical protein
MVIALTYKIKAAGNRRVVEIMVLVFFVTVCVVLVMFDHIYHVWLELSEWYNRKWESNLHKGFSIKNLL